MKNHFILIKLPGHAANGAKLSARAAALKLLDAGYWPIFRRTRNKAILKAGDEVAVYLGGAFNQIIIAKATIDSIEPWNGAYARNYPLVMDGIPENVLKLTDITILKQPVDVVDKLDQLTFIPENKKKWGVAFMGGARRVSAADFKIISS